MPILRLVLNYAFLLDKYSCVLYHYTEHILNMSIRQLLIYAIIIKLLIAPFTFHPDIKDINLRVSFLQKGVVNIYEFLESDEVTKINAPDFVYPPLAYFTLGGYQFVARAFLGNEFDNWLFDFSGKASLHENIFRYLLILKLPYLLFDLLVAWVLIKLVPDDKRKIILFFWLFNPLNLYAIYAIGQFDIIPSFFTILSYFLWKEGNLKFSALSLGLGASFKAFPLLLIPAFMMTNKKLSEKILFISISLGVYGIFLLPFIQSEAFLKNFLFSGLSQRVFQMQVPIFDFRISVFLILYIILILMKLIWPRISLQSMLLSILLLTFAVTKFHPQWIIWLTPFLALAFSLLRIKVAIILYIIAFFSIFLLFEDKFLVSGLLSPVSIQFLEIPEITRILTINQITLLQQWAKTIFAIISAIISIKTLKNL